MPTSLFSIYRFSGAMQRAVIIFPPIATLAARLRQSLFLNEEQEFSSETKPNPKRTWRRWGGVFSHERSRCFHLPVFKRKKKAESVLGWRKTHEVKEWGGRAVIGSSHRCDVCGREMKSWILKSLQRQYACAQRGSCVAHDGAHALLCVCEAQHLFLAQLTQTWLVCFL